ncbi:MAG: leucine-rich repeat domain-containing protein [Verrucomicrobiota bacterium]|nr:leucine-rich repeat domain-containing protein [Verrucomicrobiota bacterium]
MTRLSLQRRKLTEVPKELEKLTQLTLLDLRRNQLTDLKGLEKLTQLEFLMLTKGNRALTQAQIDELQKALPKCSILALPTK